ncbi:MAG: hypothetical protein ABIS18_08295 [Actinomycetota bacterium]
MKTVRLGALMGASAALVIALVTSGLALDQGDKNADGSPSAGRLKVGKGYGRLTDKKHYRSIAGYTANGSARVVNPSNCRTVPYCDIIRVDVDPGINKDPFFFQMVLTWDNPKEYDMDMSMFSVVFAKDDPETPEDEAHNPDGSRVEDSTPRVCRTIGKTFPEKCSFGVDDDTPAYYYITVFQTSDQDTVGTNTTGFDLLAEQRINEIPDCFGSGCDPSPTKRPSPTPSKKALPKTFSPPVPSPTLSPVKVPGPNGETKTFFVPVLGQTSGPKDSGRGASPLVIGVIALLVLGAGTFGFFFVRSRRAKAA